MSERDTYRSRYGPVPEELRELGIDSWAALHHLGSGNVNAVKRRATQHIVDKRNEIDDLEQEIGALHEFRTTLRRASRRTMFKPLLPQLRPLHYFSVGDSVAVYFAEHGEDNLVGLQRGAVEVTYRDGHDLGGTLENGRPWSGEHDCPYVLPVEDLEYLTAHAPFAARWFGFIDKEYQTMGFSKALELDILDIMDARIKR